MGIEWFAAVRVGSSSEIQENTVARAPSPAKVRCFLLGPSGGMPCPVPFAMHWEKSLRLQTLLSKALVGIEIGSAQSAPP